jgi:hypothetical protein
MIACLRLPDFALSIARQQHSELIGQPFVLARYTGRSGKMYAASVEARALGVRAGMTLSRARALYPEASVLPAEGTGSLQVLHDLLERLCSFSDKLEVPASPDPEDTCIWLDLGKLSEAEVFPLGQRILHTVGNFPAALGIARGKTLARIAALHTLVCEITLVASGTERRWKSRSNLPSICSLGRSLNNIMDLIHWCCVFNQ